jgi:hypothetical protein
MSLLVSAGRACGGPPVQFCWLCFWRRARRRWSKLIVSISVLVQGWEQKGVVVWERCRAGRAGRCLGAALRSKA